MTTTTTTATHYRLSIELTTHVSPDTRDGEPGEVVVLADLVATDGETGGRWVYVGNVPCSTQGEALELMARIFAWERRRDDNRLDPTEKPACWAAERAPADRQATGSPAPAEGPELSRGAEGEPVVVDPPVAHAGEPAVSGDTFEVPVKPGTVTIGGRRRKVDAGKVRRLAVCAVT